MNRIKTSRFLPLLSLLFVYLAASTSDASDSVASAPAGADFNVLTLNLHGYHPSGEPERWLQDRNLQLHPAESNLYFFTLDELRRGHERRLDLFREAIAAMPTPPSVILLQEVGAGLPASPKDCAEFRDATRPDGLGKNVALQIRNRLRLAGLNYEASVACRGNIGWQTQDSLLRDQRVVKFVGEGTARHPEVVFDYGSNPYPSGTIVEGTAILVREPYEILDGLEWRLTIPGTNEIFFFQTVRIREKDSAKWILVANLHGGHKVRHFEEAVFVRQALSEYAAHHQDSANFVGTIVGGDFNAYLYRPSRSFGEVSTIPWEIAQPNEFDFGAATGSDKFKFLEETLWKMNLDGNYKPWASLGDSAGAHDRVKRAVSAFQTFVKSPLATFFSLRETFDEAVRLKKCEPAEFPSLDAACATEDRIDLLYATPNLRVENGVVVFERDDFRTLNSVSDHPGILVRFRPLF